MRDAVVARRYARALFQIAVERGILDAITREVAAFENNLTQNQGFRLFLYSQDVSKKEKRARLEAALQDKVSNVFVNFLIVLIRKGREFIFSTIAQEFGRMVDVHNRRTHAATTTAVPLDSQTRAQLKAVLDKAFDKDVHIDNLIDAAILGGIVVNVDGKVLDGSLRSQLQRLHAQLREGTNLN